MRSDGYRSTSGYRNWVKRRAWLPVINGDLAQMKSGAVYKITARGWIRAN